MPRNLCGPARLDYCRASHRATISPVARGCSAVGSASPCQGEGRGFESRHPLEGAIASIPAVEWPSGEATACKAVHTGSIPVSTSRFVSPARLAQRESASLTRKRSLVQSQYRAPQFVQINGAFYAGDPKLRAISGLINRLRWHTAAAGGARGVACTRHPVSRPRRGWRTGSIPLRAPRLTSSDRRYAQHHGAEQALVPGGTKAFGGRIR